MRQHRAGEGHAGVKALAGRRCVADELLFIERCSTYEAVHVVQGAACSLAAWPVPRRAGRNMPLEEIESNLG